MSNFQNESLVEKVRVYLHILVRVYGGGGGLFDYSVTPGPSCSNQV